MHMGVLELNQFFSRLLTRRPAAALVTWESRAALEAFTLRLPDAVASSSPGATVSEIVGGDLDSTAFAEVLAAQMTEWNAGNRVLLIREVESLATKAGRILNGFRERLASFTAVVVVIREDRSRDFRSACPDWMDWVGTFVVRAEDVAPPLTLDDVDAAIRRLEVRYGMDSQTFVCQRQEGSLQPMHDSWLWSELLAIRHRLAESSTE